MVAAPPPPTGAAVTIQFIADHPATVTVTKGTVMTFTNLDNTRHSALFASQARIRITAPFTARR